MTLAPFMVIKNLISDAKLMQAHIAKTDPNLSIIFNSNLRDAEELLQQLNTGYEFFLRKKKP